MWPEANQHFSKEIDDEANSYFQRIYNHPPHPTMSVDEVSRMQHLLKRIFCTLCNSSRVYAFHTLVNKLYFLIRAYKHKEPIFVFVFNN